MGGNAVVGGGSDVSVPSLSVVHAIARLNVGGAALNLLGLAAEQRRRGHDVVVVAGTLAKGEASMEYVATELGVPVLHVPALQRELSVRADLAAIRALRRIITTRRPDILHTHTAKAGATGRIGALLVGPRPAARNGAHIPRPCPPGLFRAAPRAGVRPRGMAARAHDRGGRHRER